MKLIQAVSLAIAFTTSASADILSVHCPLGCPANSAENDLIFGHLYAIPNNPNTKFADWVAYEVNVTNFGDTPGRKWSSDPLLDRNKTLEADDYKGASHSALEADRGHQAPLASFAGSQYWSELNYLSNITPQDKDLNQGPWKNLEAAVRHAVGFRNSLFVITGPIYSANMPSMPGADEEHLVPNAYFKVIYNKKGDTAAFMMQQSSERNDDYCQKAVTLAEIQEAIDFKLPNTLHVDQEIYARLDCQQ
ncbi:DNA/RNA non-specific endonuclease [Amphritea sp. 2_MG-2023]|uniref:DNA/RNA non-specific endonuclease n=1 Tax=Amphritea TaxID=515417 RepID=UPI001C06C372|nr:DNA/RNA non-specific endonuclease [Amphritea sp. 2_MG-2023]MBU2964682.1 DNA/RNA non-specific endonuclease [Amphritea atlantica]MDO6420265.1 DNA/RNA non-specific endonuclease [Amphritea sp. 2_MG-2023]